MTFDVNVYPQFHPSSASDVREVVLAKRNTPVRTGERGWVSEDCGEWKGQRGWGGREERRGKGRTGGDGERAFAAEVGQLDEPAGEQRAGDADDAEDDLLCGVSGCGTM